jgi:hypothetical protein
MANYGSVKRTIGDSRRRQTQTQTGHSMDRETADTQIQIRMSSRPRRTDWLSVCKVTQNSGRGIRSRNFIKSKNIEINTSWVWFRPCASIVWTEGTALSPYGLQWYQIQWLGGPQSQSERDGKEKISAPGEKWSSSHFTDRGMSWNRKANFNVEYILGRSREFSKTVLQDLGWSRTVQPWIFGKLKYRNNEELV